MVDAFHRFADKDIRFCNFNILAEKRWPDGLDLGLLKLDLPLLELKELPE
jgi:hypothetical protein